jgi:hypothetical protein
MRSMSIHKQISFIKSGIRILGYIGCAAAFWDIKLAFYAFVVLIFSELVGIYEEVGEK